MKFSRLPRVINVSIMALAFLSLAVISPLSNIANATGLQVGGRVQVTAVTGGVGVNVRTLPSTSAPLATGTPNPEPAGALGTIVAGPTTTADGYTWYEVNYDSGPEGWSISTRLTPVAVSEDQTSGDSAIPHDASSPGGYVIALINVSTPGNTPTPPFTQAQLQADLSSGGRVSAFFANTSYNKFTFAPSIPSDWITFASPVSDNTAAQATAQWNQLLQAAESAVPGANIFIVNAPHIASTGGTNPTINSAISDYVGDQNAAGYTANGQSFVYEANPNATNALQGYEDVLIHEVGHRLGFGLAVNSPGSAGNDPIDPMAPNGQTTLHGFNIIFRENAGWTTPATNEAQISSNTTSQTVNCIEGGTGILDAVVAVPSQPSLHVEWRCSDPGVGMVIHEVATPSASACSAGADCTGVDTAVVSPAEAQAEGVTIQSLGTLPDGSGGTISVTYGSSTGTPPPGSPPPPTVGAPPGYTLGKDIGTDDGDFDLACPSAPIAVTLGGAQVTVPLTVIGSDGRGGLVGPAGPGADGAPMTGDADELGYTTEWQIGTFSNVVAPYTRFTGAGSYSVEYTAQGLNYVAQAPSPGNPNGEPEPVEVFSSCDVTFNVTGSAVTPSTVGAWIWANNEADGGVGEASPLTTYVQPGNPVALSFATQNVNISSCTITDGNTGNVIYRPQDVSGSGIEVGDASVEDTYTITCNTNVSSPATVSSSVDVKVGTPPPPTTGTGSGGVVAQIGGVDCNGDCTALGGGSAQPPINYNISQAVNVNAGDSVQFAWESTNATTCSITPTPSFAANPGWTGPNGQSVIADIQEPMTLNLSCNDGAGHVATAQLQIVVHGTVSGGSPETVGCTPENAIVPLQGGSSSVVCQLAGGGTSPTWSVIVPPGATQGYGQSIIAQYNQTTPATISSSGSSATITFHAPPASVTPGTVNSGASGDAFVEVDNNPLVASQVGLTYSYGTGSGSTPPPVFTPGESVMISAGGSSAKVRATPAGTVLGKEADGTKGTIDTANPGPQVATLNGVSGNWWNVDFNDPAITGGGGWVSESLLAPAGGSSSDAGQNPTGASAGSISFTAPTANAKVSGTAFPINATIANGASAATIEIDIDGGAPIQTCTNTSTCSTTGDADFLGQPGSIHVIHAEATFAGGGTSEAVVNVTNGDPVASLADQGQHQVSQTFKAGDRVVAHGGGTTVNVRFSAGGNVLFQESNGALGTVGAGPTPATLSGVKDNWWQVAWDNNPTEPGWTAESVLAMAPSTGPGTGTGTGTSTSTATSTPPAPTPPPTPTCGTGATPFIANETIAVTGTAGGVKVRETPSITGTVKGVQPAGAVGTITAVTPVCASGYVWYKVSWAKQSPIGTDDQTGWSVGYFTPASAQSPTDLGLNPPPGGGPSDVSESSSTSSSTSQGAGGGGSPPPPSSCSGITVGCPIITTADVNVRSAPSGTSTALGQEPSGTEGTVTASPVLGSGGVTTWVGVSFAASGTKPALSGYVAIDYLNLPSSREAADADVPGGTGLFGPLPAPPPPGPGSVLVSPSFTGESGPSDSPSPSDLPSHPPLQP